MPEKTFFVLVRKTEKPYISTMRLRRHHSLRRTASAFMLFAVIAFVLQGTSVLIASAAAAAGFLPQPSELVVGPIHFHGQIGHHAHVSGDDGPGHVHIPAKGDQSDLDHDSQIWIVGCSSAVISVMAACSVVFDVTGIIEPLPPQRLAGFDPDGLSRPPSTPSIA